MFEVEVMAIFVVAAAVPLLLSIFKQRTTLSAPIGSALIAAALFLWLNVKSFESLSSLDYGVPIQHRAIVWIFCGFLVFIIWCIRHFAERWLKNEKVKDLLSVYLIASCSLAVYLITYW